MKYTKGTVLYMRVKVIDAAPFEDPKQHRTVVESVDRAGEPTSGTWYVVNHDELITPQTIRDAIIGGQRRE